ncbi:hypothetical protein ACHAXT_005833 [Thalassiosira profunda]
MPPCKDRAAQRAPTLRKMSSSGLSSGDDAAQAVADRSDGLAQRAKAREPFTDDELNDVINSLHNITPKDATIDWDALRTLLADVAHISHKDWHVTDSNSDKMAEILLPDGGGLSEHAHQMFERILHEGNWDGALQHARAMEGKAEGGHKPWVVLVTGVNGIRKTTSTYQPWFSEVLQEALVHPSTSEGGETTEFTLEELPTGDNSFFRQLDHLITTVCNEDFSMLYALTGAQQDKEGGSSNEGEEGPPKELVKQYSNLKASIFSRYRTLSELLGVLLLKEAQTVNINTMCETSGRDIAMFRYIDHFFSNQKYHKLAIHFTINDLSCAMQSVDDRMAREIETGNEALKSGDVTEVIYANAGGPYGSEVLAGVQADSDRVWNEVVMAGEGAGVGGDWHKAELRVFAHAEKPWTIRAVRPDGSLGTEHTFGDPRTV